MQLQIISGPSSSGKSTYILKVGPPHDVLLFPRDVTANALGCGKRLLLHYNILRPFNHHYAKLRWETPRRWLRLPPLNPFESEPLWRTLPLGNVPTSATVLVAPRQIILDRMAKREAVEPLRQSSGKHSYPQDDFTQLLGSLDLAVLYRHWIDFLVSRGIAAQFVDSSNHEYRVLSDQDQVFRLLTAPPAV